jgi:hypothetical protein
LHLALVQVYTILYESTGQDEEVQLRDLVAAGEVAWPLSEADKRRAGEAGPAPQAFGRGSEDGTRAGRSTPAASDPDGKGLKRRKAAGAPQGGKAPAEAGLGGLPAGGSPSQQAQPGQPATALGGQPQLQAGGPQGLPFYPQPGGAHLVMGPGQLGSFPGLVMVPQVRIGSAGLRAAVTCAVNCTASRGLRTAHVARGVACRSTRS